MEKLNPVTVIPHSESTLDEEVEFTTSTQYVISGSTSGISRVKGAVQVREMSVSTRSIDKDPTAASRPIKNHYSKCIYFPQSWTPEHNIIIGGSPSIVLGLPQHSK